MNQLITDPRPLEDLAATAGIPEDETQEVLTIIDRDDPSAPHLGRTDADTAKVKAFTQKLANVFNPN